MEIIIIAFLSLYAVVLSIILLKMYMTAKASASNNKEAAEIHESERVFLRDRLLESLVGGTMTFDETAKSALCSLGVSFVSDYFVILLIDIMNSNNNTSGFISKMENGLAEHVCLDNPSYLFSMDKMLICLINLTRIDENDLTQSSMDIVDILNARVNRYVEYLDGEGGFSMNISISNVCNGVSGLRYVYLKALSQANTRVVKDDAPSDDIHESTEQAAYSDALKNLGLGSEIEIHTKLQKQYYDAIVRHDFESASEIIGYIIDSELTDYLNSMLMKTRMKERVGWAVVIPFMDNVTEEPIQQELRELSESITNAKNADEMKHAAKDVFDRLDSYFNPKKRDMGIKIEEISEYIQQNYMDPELNATKVCEKFGFSVSYLTHQFRAVSGKKMLDFIHETRVSHACRLLLETGLSIGDIAAQTGFSSGWTMSRVFQKITGETPTYYRERQRMGSGRN